MSLVDMVVGNNTGAAQKNDPPLAPVAPYGHGQGGLFNRRDRSNPVISTVMSPLGGVANAIPVFNGARDLDNNFGGTDWAYDSLITGVTAGDLDTFANQPTQPCDDGPVAGLTKFCTMVNTYGAYKMSTREVEIDRAGRAYDMVDAELVQVLNNMPAGVFAVPSDTPSEQNAMNNELARRIWEMASVGFPRMFYPRVFIGSPANNVGVAQDIVGLDIHINAGNKRDALSGALCSAADSDVKSFGGSVIGGSKDIIQYIEQCDRYVMWNASRQGLGVPSYIIAMNPNLYQALCQVVPIQKYQQVGILMNNLTNGRAIVNLNDVYNEKNAMLATPALPVNGRIIPVVLDDTIAETSTIPGGVPTYASTIYGIPLTVMGGYPVTFWEYWNHDNLQSRAIQQRATGLTWTTDGGMFRWTSDFSKGCLKLNVSFKPRLRMRTPQLAWRIDNVAAQPLQHLRDWDPTSSYFADGGTTTGDGDRLYTSWSPSTPVYPNA